MTIGFDLDNVFIGSPPFVPRTLIRKLYGEKVNGVLKYRMPSYPEQIVRQISHFSPLRPPLKENLALLSRLPRKGNTFYLISSRYGFLKKQTATLIEKYHLDELFDALYFNYENKQPHLFKDEVLQQLHPDIYIDDDLPLLQYVAKRNGETKFFWLNHSNTEKKLEDNIIAITQLSDALSEVK